MDPKLDKMLKIVSNDAAVMYKVTMENVIVSTFPTSGAAAKNEKDAQKALLKIEAGLKKLGQQAQLTIKAAQKLAVEVKAAEQYLKAIQKKR